MHTKAIVLRHIVEVNLLHYSCTVLFYFTFILHNFDKKRCETRNSGLAFTTDQGPLSIIKSYDSIYTAALASTSDSLEPTVQTFLGVGVGMRTV